MSARDLTAAQLLLTLGDTEDRRRYLNARETLNTLLTLRCVPVINENDTVATAEIRFGDNDRLAARVAEMVQADQLILLSDIDGLYTADPRRDPVGRPHPGRRGALRPRSRRWAASRRPAIRPAACAPSWWRLGSPPRPVARWRSRSATSNGRCRPWNAVPAAPGSCRCRKAAPPASAGLRGSLSALGVLTVDAGAARALAGGRSLLPAGVRAVEGAFERGDPVTIVGPDGAVLGRGLSAYASADAERIAGHRSDQIEAILGWRGRDEMVHRDDLVLG